MLQQQSSGASKRSVIMSNIFNNNNQSLKSSRNNSFCVGSNSYGVGGSYSNAPSRRISQLLLSPGQVSMQQCPPECPMCRRRRESTISNLCVMKIRTIKF